MYVSLAAYSCRDSLGFGRVSPTPCSLLSPSRDTSAIIAQRDIHPARQEARTRGTVNLQDCSELPYRSAIGITGQSLPTPS